MVAHANRVHSHNNKAASLTHIFFSLFFVVPLVQTVFRVLLSTTCYLVLCANYTECFTIFLDVNNKRQKHSFHSFFYFALHLFDSMRYSCFSPPMRWKHILRCLITSMAFFLGFVSFFCVIHSVHC